MEVTHLIFSDVLRYCQGKRALPEIMCEKEALGKKHFTHHGVLPGGVLYPECVVERRH